MNAQEPEPTPFEPIIPLGNPNVGLPEPYAVSDIAFSVGLSEWQLAGWSGRGIKIGVLDRGFGQFTQFIEDFDIAVHIAPGSDLSDYSETAIRHGNQVLETLYAIAPQAEYYTCAYDNLAEFNRCITWMIRSDIDIINHSVGVPALPLDGTNPWALEVDRAAREDILVVVER
ncbi:MAG: hypothetical protein Phog2KO_50700 [Phototrophicaceae bacterium]